MEVRLAWPRLSSRSWRRLSSRCLASAFFSVLASAFSRLGLGLCLGLGLGFLLGLGLGFRLASAFFWSLASAFGFSWALIGLGTTARASIPPITSKASVARASRRDQGHESWRIGSSKNDPHKVEWGILGIWEFSPTEGSPRSSRGFTYGGCAVGFKFSSANDLPHNKAAAAECATISSGDVMQIHLSDESKAGMSHASLFRLSGSERCSFANPIGLRELPLSVCRSSWHGPTGMNPSRLARNSEQCIRCDRGGGSAHVRRPRQDQAAPRPVGRGHGRLRQRASPAGPLEIHPATKP